jgi:hypothetical protein
MLEVNKGRWIAALGAIALATLACTCNLGEQLAGGLSDTGEGDAAGTNGAQSGESGSAQATLNPQPESIIEPTTAPPTQAPVTGPSFLNPYFSSAIDDAGRPLEVAAEFPDGTSTVYAFSTWAGMQDGAPFKTVWTQDGQVTADGEYTWNLGPEGEDIWISNLYSDSGAISPGLYTWELQVNGEPMVAGSFTVGGQGAVLLQDDFEDPNSGWEVGAYDAGSVGYEGGAYAATSIQEDKMMWGLANDIFQNAEIHVDATQVQAPPNNNNAYGVMCRVREGGTGYLLRISGDGFYAITLVDGPESFLPLVDWTASDAIRQGNSTNQIGAVCDGGYFALYANGTLLAEAWDDSFQSGDIALTTTSFESAPSKVLFDNIIVTAP